MHFMSLLYTHGEIKEESFTFTEMGCWHIYHTGIQEWVLPAMSLASCFNMM